MTRSKAARWLAWGTGTAALLACSCGPFESHNLLVLNNDLVIPATAGGTAEVTFLGLEGWTISISLVGHRSGMVPFAALVGPHGGQIAAPPVTSAVDNTNAAEVTLAEDGTYRLLIEDASGRGGSVSVRIER